MGLFQIIVYGYLQFMTLQVSRLTVLESYVRSKSRRGFWSLYFLEQNQLESQMFESQKTFKKLGKDLMYEEANGGDTSKAPEHPAPYI